MRPGGPSTRGAAGRWLGTDPTGPPHPPQAALIATEIHPGIPVRAVARQARGIIGEEDADLAQRDLPDQCIKALSVQGTRGTLADIGVHDLNGLWGPTQRPGPLGESVLELEAFLVAQGLGGAPDECRAGLCGSDVGV
jgi:hypothetical protein